MNTFNELLKKRRSCRRFTEESVDKESLNIILEAALMSPSGHRINPWEFVVVEDKEMLKKLSVSKAAGANLIENAALAIVVIANTTMSDVWIEDCSIVGLNMQLAAEDLGLGSCWVQIRARKDAEGNDANDNVKNMLQIPEDYSVLSIIAIGHKAVGPREFDESRLQWNKVHKENYKVNYNR